MPSDKSTKSSNNHKYSTRSKKKMEKDNYKRNSPDDNDNSHSDDSDSEFDPKEYRNMLAQLFPSKYMSDKAKSGRSSQKDKEDEIKKNAMKKFKKGFIEGLKEGRDEENNKNSVKKSSKKSDKKNTKKEKKEAFAKLRHNAVEEEDEEYDEESDPEYVEESSSEEASDEYEYDDEDDYDEDDDDEIAELLQAGNGKFNIIFTMGGHLDEDDEEYSSEEETSSDEESDEEENPNKKKNNDEEENPKNTISDKEAIEKFKKMVEGLSEEEKNNSIVKGMISDFEAREKACKKRENKKFKKIKNKNTKQFRKLLKEKNVMNDVKYFKENMSVEQQEMVMKQMEELKLHYEVDRPYRLALLDANIPINYKACAIKKINTLKYMEPGGGEYYKIKQWVDTFMRIPFGKIQSLPITINDGIEKCNNFMEDAKNTLDNSVFGLNDAKMQIMQMVGQWIANPKAVGSAIAIKGPMGTGKTTLVKEGISKILGRDFAFIALGGATDSSFLEGHSYTYEGSTWGKIVDVLVQSKHMNPVFYFDELDKVSDTPKGEEIIGILTHLIDTSQSDKYHDKYFSEIDFDLSKCLFIFSYNDENKVNPILLDRMYRIQTKGYETKEKIIIANKYLTPKIREQVMFTEKDIIIPEETLTHIINEYTDKEQGVRNLKRCLEIIHTKLNLFRLMKPDSSLFDEELSKLKIEFPVTVTCDLIDKLIIKEKSNLPPMGMYM